MSIAFLFPGQGSQRVGMGLELHRDQPELFARYLSVADRATGAPISQMCIDGDQEALTQTQVAQPAVFAISLALAAHAEELGLRTSAMAGHSLGEYTAAVASGSLDVESGMLVVAERGRLMARAQAERPGRMIAVMGLEMDHVSALCTMASGHGTAVVANVNSPLQIVVSGDAAAVERVQELALIADADDVVPLAAGAAFHSPLMSSVRAELTQLLERLDWDDPRVPVVSNSSGAALGTAAEVRTALADQIDTTLMWVSCVRTLLALGCDSFVEIGPGRVLTGLLRQIDPDLQVRAADSPAKLRRVVESLAAGI